MHRNRMLKGIIFDLDGVIVNSHSAHKKAWRGLLQSLGREAPEKALEFVVEGHKREEILRHFLGELNGEEVHHYGSLKDSFFAQFAHEVTTVPGVLQFFEQAQAEGLALAVGTSAGRRRAEETLERLGLRSRLGAIATGDEVPAGKPDPAVFQLAASRLGIATGNVLVCEDAVAGVQAAKRAGMRCLAIAANGRRTLLATAGADWVVQDFTETTVKQVTNLFSNNNKGKSAYAGQL